MIDFDGIQGFEWDEGNSRKNLEKHDVSTSEAESVFFNNPLVVSEDWKHSEIEPRFNALGITNEGRPLHLTFTLRANRTLLRVISTRDMNRRERRIYEKA